LLLSLKVTEQLNFTDQFCVTL